MARVKRKAPAPMTTKQYLETYSGVALVLLLIFGGAYYYNSRPPEVADPALAQAEMLFNQNNFFETNRILDEKLKTDSRNVSLLLAKAATLAQEASLTFREKELGDEARSFVERALAINPRSVEAYTLLGYTYEIQQDYIQAHAAYDKALKIDPNYEPALAQQAHAFDLEGNLTQAKVQYERAITSVRNAKTLAGYGRILILTGNIEEAKKIFAEVIDKSDNNRLTAETLFTLASLNETQTYSLENEMLYRRAIEKDPTLAMPYVGLAKELFKKSSVNPESDASKTALSDSFTQLETALKINPNQSHASLQLAIQMYAIGNTSFAQKVLTRLKSNVEYDITLSRSEKDVILAMASSLLTTI